MSTALSFRKLNEGWNAEPNAPWPRVATSGHDVLLRFLLNPFQFPTFAEEDQGVLRFKDCTWYRLGATNDEGWYRGQCRYSALAPSWGEFYEISGSDPHLMDPTDWKVGAELRFRPATSCSIFATRRLSVSPRTGFSSLLPKMP